MARWLEILKLIGVFDKVDESPTTGKISLGLSVIVRVTLRDGTYHEVCCPVSSGDPKGNHEVNQLLLGCRIWPY